MNSAVPSLMTRRGFLTASGGLVASSALPSFAEADGAAFPVRSNGARRYDASLVALISDLHVNGLKDEVPTHCYEYVGLPSTGHWGDIGFATMRTFPDRVEITNHQNDFFFTGGPGDGQPMHDDIVREQNNQKVTLRI